MLWITTTPGSAVQSNGSTVCMIGGSGSLPAKIARTKSMPGHRGHDVGRRDAVFDLGAGWSVMGRFLRL